MAIQLLVCSCHTANDIHNLLCNQLTIFSKNNLFEASKYGKETAYQSQGSNPTQPGENQEFLPYGLHEELHYRLYAV